MPYLQDESSVLPDGKYFPSWETEQEFDRELHVCQETGCDASGDGSAEKPFQTIQAAANLAEPGTRVVIHAGTYREWVNPLRGGESPERMIAYEAAGDGEVVIKASCVMKSYRRSGGWNLYRGRTAVVGTPVVWETKLNPDEFRGYNPFNAVNILHDRLFIEYDKTDMTTYLNRRGMVFVDNEPLEQVALYNQMASKPGTYWVEANGQTVHFRLKDDGDPKDHLIELTCREQCFAPEESFLSYIKVKGLTCAHAATGAPVPQCGAISAHRGHHWIIEDCTVDWSNAVGIDIGNECWHRERMEGQQIGYSVIRRCKILNCGVCGIAGMGVHDMLVEDNLIEGTGWQKMELSWEAGGIKVHNSVNGLIRRNVFRSTFRADALWMDVGNINNRITRNLFLDGKEAREHIFIEATRDAENMIDNNIFWNIEGRFQEKNIPAEPGSSGWYKMEEKDVVNGYAIYGEGTDRLRISNNFIGKCRSAGYFQKIVAFRLMGRGGTSRNAKLFNNVFYQCEEAAIKFPTEKNEAEGNVYAKCYNGYLRILYPAPAECLDLAAWQEFHGFDLTGVDADFEVDVDVQALTMKVSPADPNKAPRMMRRISANLVKGYDQLPAVARDPKIACDFFGNPVIRDRMAGPFEISLNDTVFSIDPRKLS